MTNQSDKPLYVLKAFSPPEMSGERLTNNLFMVIDATGKRARYTSIWSSGVSYLADGLDGSSFDTLAPRQSLSAKVDLSRSYDLSAGGPFKVTYDRYVIGEQSRNEQGVMRFNQTMMKTTSNTLEIWINQALLNAAKPVIALNSDQGTNAAATCDASQTATIDAALSRAAILARSVSRWS